MSHTHPVRSGYLAALAKAANEGLGPVQSYAKEMKLDADGGYLTVFDSTNMERKWLTVQIGNVRDSHVAELTTASEARAQMLCELPRLQLLAQHRSRFGPLSGARRVQSGALRVDGFVIGFAGFFSLDDPFLIVTAYQARLITKSTARDLVEKSGNSHVEELFVYTTRNSLRE